MKFFAGILMLFTCLTFSFAQDKGAITVTVVDIEKPGEGVLIFTLFDQSDGFPNERDKGVYTGQLSSFEAQASYTFKEVPYGTYALSVHQDKNENGEVDANFIGIPKEPVGASNMSKMGRPNFSKCAFSVEGAHQEMTLNFIIQ